MGKAGPILCLLALALAGCGGGSDLPGEDQPATIRIVTSHAVQDRLEQLSLAERNRVFEKAIRESGGRCGSVTTSSYQRDYQRLFMWTARCRAGGRGGEGDWALFVQPDGRAQIRNCADHRQLGLPQCWIIEEAEPLPAVPI